MANNTATENHRRIDAVIIDQNKSTSRIYSFNFDSENQNMAYGYTNKQSFSPCLDGNPYLHAQISWPSWDPALLSQQRLRLSPVASLYPARYCANHGQ